MGVHRHGISLQVFNSSIVHELDTRIEIPYLQATMYYCVHYINTIALY